MVDLVYTDPKQFTITESDLAAAATVTSGQILVGTVSGGPYPTIYNLTTAEITAGLANGIFTGTLASVGEKLGAGKYYAVAQLINAAGIGPLSAEVEVVFDEPLAPPNFGLA
jgi:hypothetical protein